MNKTHFAILLSLALLGPTALVLVRAEMPGEAVPASFVVAKNVMVPMRDGVRLFTDTKRGRGSC